MICKTRPKPCPVCGKVFKPANKAVISCSRECSYKRRKRFFTPYYEARRARVQCHRFMRSKLPEFVFECSHCGHVGDLDAHHEDYSKPFVVVMLCRSCHRSHHGFRPRNLKEIDLEALIKEKAQSHNKA